MKTFTLIIATFFLTIGLGFSQKNLTDTITVLSFNDFHGSFIADKGCVGINAFVSAMLQQKKSNPNPIVLSGGDNFSGKFFPMITRGELMFDIFDTLDVKASVVGNHEFDFGLPYLIDTFAKKIDLLSANIKNKNDSLTPAWLKPYKIIEQPLSDGSHINIAVIGLTTTTTPEQTKTENVAPFIFTDPYVATGQLLTNELKKAKADKSVDMILVLMHIGTDMRLDSIIEEKNAVEIPYLINVDGIISAHSHLKVLSKINEVPIIQAACYGNCIGKLQYQIKRKKNKLKITYIGGDTITVPKSASDKTSDELINKTMAKYGLNDVIVNLDDDIIYNRAVDKFSYAKIGALVTESYVDFYRHTMPTNNDEIIIGVNHAGGLRDNLYKGGVTRLQACNVLPFGNPITAFHMSGKDFKALLNSGRHNDKGFLQSSFLTMHINKNNDITKLFYTNNGKNIEITDDMPCTVVTDDFITTGGDNYDPRFFSGRGIKEFNSKGIPTFNAFVDYLVRTKNISVKRLSVPVEVKE